MQLDIYLFIIDYSVVILELRYGTKDSFKYLNFLFN